MDQILDHLEEATVASPSDEPPSAAGSIEDSRASAETTEAAELRVRLQLVESELASWRAAASDTAHAALCSPKMCSYYASLVEDQLRAGLLAIEGITGVKWCLCSFPSVRSAEPHLVLREWRGLETSKWSLVWSPPWAVEVCVEGSYYVSATAVVRLEKIAIKSDDLSLRFNADLSHVAISFGTPPNIDMAISTETKWCDSFAFSPSFDSP
eukprot:SAG31_NODE_217_length_19988_cov_53.300820_4_plen_211_part_00